MMTEHEFSTYEEQIETPEGRGITGRIHGQLIAEDRQGVVRAYRTIDKRVLIYDENQQRAYDVSDDPVKAFRGWFGHDDDAFVDAMEAIGEKPVIDL
jgi:hypothetical protein